MMTAKEALALTEDGIKKEKEKELIRILDSIEYEAKRGRTKYAAFIDHEETKKELYKLGYKILLLMSGNTIDHRLIISWGEPA